MNRPKVPPKHTANSVINLISGYLCCVKLGIFLLNSQGLKSKTYISVHKMAPRIETNQLIVLVITIKKNLSPTHKETIWRSYGPYK